MEKIRVILIDPKSKSVTEQFIDNNLQGFYNLLECDMIEAAYPRNMGGHFIYCDEEGTFKRPLYFFEFAGFHSPLCGKACIVRADGDNSASCQMDVAEVRKLVLFQPFQIKRS